LALFCVLATLGAQGFGKTLSAWLILAALYCVVAAALRREPPWGRELTHFDEAAAYAAIGAFAAWAS
jgi:hypothetical protein